MWHSLKVFLLRAFSWLNFVFFHLYVLPSAPALTSKFSFLDVQELQFIWRMRNLQIFIIHPSVAVYFLKNLFCHHRVFQSIDFFFFLENVVLLKLWSYRFNITLIKLLPRWFSGKESACQWRRHKLDPWVGKIPWRRKWQPTPVLLPGKSQGWRSLGGCSARGYKRVRHDVVTKTTTTITLYIYNKYRCSKSYGQ